MTYDLPNIRVAPLDRPVDALVVLDLGTALRPPWLSGEVRLPVGAAAAALPGEPLAHLVVGGERLVAVAREGGQVRFGFDPAATLLSLATEAYLPPARRPLVTRLPRWYGLLPGSWRLRGYRFLTRRWGEKVPGTFFPVFPAWPIEPAGAVLLEVLRRCGARPRPAWPGGARFALAVCHDVDTRKGLRSVGTVRAVEAKLGLKSGWAVVAGRYNGYEGLLDELRAEGGEVLCHGARHDFRLPYLGPAGIASRLEQCRPMIERFGTRGFRSPGMLTSADLRRALREAFEYDTSVPDTAVRTPIGPRRGVTFVEPFVVEGLLELPLTVPLEDTLLLLGYAAAGILDLWRRKVAWVKAVGGLAMLTTHAERHLGARPDILAAYAELVKELAADRDAWIATPGEIARHWRAQIDEGHA